MGPVVSKEKDIIMRIGFYGVCTIYFASVGTLKDAASVTDP